MDKEVILKYIDELHHNRDQYSRSKLLELIKEKINCGGESSKTRSCTNCRYSETKTQYDPCRDCCKLGNWESKIIDVGPQINEYCIGCKNELNDEPCFTCFDGDEYVKK